MSWSVQKAGRSSKMAETIKQAFIDAGGAPKGSGEEAAKNACGDVAEALCKSFAEDRVVSVSASGSAWNENGKAKHQTLRFEFTTFGDFVE